MECQKKKYYTKMKDNHDRLSLNVTTGQVSGHGYGHSDSFDTSKDKSKKK